MEAPHTFTLKIRMMTRPEPHSTIFSIRWPAREGSGIRRIASHDEIVAMGGDPNAFLALEAADGTSFAFGYTGELKNPSKGGGTHGYFPDRPQMRASMIFFGPAIGTGKIDHARLIDVAPTVATWLGFKFDKTDGSALSIPMNRCGWNKMTFRFEVCHESSMRELLY